MISAPARQLYILLLIVLVIIQLDAVVLFAVVLVHAALLVGSSVRCWCFVDVAVIILAEMLLFLVLLVVDVYKLDANEPAGKHVADYGEHRACDPPAAVAVQARQLGVFVRVCSLLPWPSNTACGWPRAGGPGAEGRGEPGGRVAQAVHGAPGKQADKAASVGGLVEIRLMLCGGLQRFRYTCRRPHPVCLCADLLGRPARGPKPLLQSLDEHEKVRELRILLQQRANDIAGPRAIRRE